MVLNYILVGCPCGIAWVGRRYLSLVDRCLGRFRLYTDVALFFFSIIGEREVLFIFLSRALGSLLKKRVCEHAMLVYHLHEQTGLFPVWANGKQTSRLVTWLVNFVPELRLTFVQISSIYQQTTTKAWNWYQRWPWINGTRISVYKTLRPAKQNYLSRCLVASGNFPL